ncbi:MAG: hypothetical protein QM736_14530 [Vicinamibacterales bacterium]
MDTIATALPLASGAKDRGCRGQHGASATAIRHPIGWSATVGIAIPTVATDGAERSTGAAAAATHIAIGEHAVVARAIRGRVSRSLRAGATTRNIEHTRD